MSDVSSTPDLYNNVKRIIEEIETEMKQTGYWSDEPLPENACQFRQAFAMDTMPFSQWVQFIFIPRVRSIIVEKSSFPKNSMVGTQALREFGGDEAGSKLVSLLIEFDKIINRGC